MEKRADAEDHPFGFHLVNQLTELSACVKKHGGDELAGKIYALVGEVPDFRP